MAANNNRILVGNSQRQRALGAVTPAPAPPAAGGGGGARGGHGGRGGRGGGAGGAGRAGRAGRGGAQGHYISVLAKSPRVDQDFGDAYGGPPGILAPWLLRAGNRQLLDDFLRLVYPQTLAAQGHPLGDNEGRTRTFFNDMLNHAVLPIANGAVVVDQRVTVGIDQQADPAQRDPRIHHRETWYRHQTSQLATLCRRAQEVPSD